MTKFMLRKASYLYFCLFKVSFLMLMKLWGTECQNTIQEIDSTNVQSSCESNCVILTLENSISRALNYNRQLLDTVESLTQAQYGVDLAKNEFHISMTPTSQAGYFGSDKEKPEWKMGGGIDFSKKFTTGTLVSVIPSLTKARNHSSMDIQTTITQPLLRGLGSEYQLSNLRGAQFVLRTAYRHLYVEQVRLVTRTIQILYEMIKLEKSLILNQESYQRIKNFYKAAKLKEKMGISDSLNVYRAEIELRQAEDVLKGTEERLEEAQDHLRDLLALPLDFCFKLDIPILYTAQQIDVEKAIDIALNHRIEMEQARDEWSENERLSRLAKQNLYPEINLVLNYSNLGRGKSFSHSFTNDRENRWGVGIASSLDIYSGRNEIAYEQSMLAMDSAARSIDQTEATLILEVKKAVRQLDRAFERIHLQEEQIKTAQGELHLAKIKFDRGMADNFPVIQAEKSLRTAELNYWSALIDHMIGEYQLLASMGLLIDKPKF